MPKLFSFALIKPQPADGSLHYHAESDSTGVFGAIRKGWCERKNEYVFEPSKHTSVMNIATLREIADFMEKLPPIPVEPTLLDPPKVAKHK